jgi:hypothetical protein
VLSMVAPASTCLQPAGSGRVVWLCRFLQLAWCDCSCLSAVPEHKPSIRLSVCMLWPVCGIAPVLLLLLPAGLHKLQGNWQAGAAGLSRLGAGQEHGGLAAVLGCWDAVCMICAGTGRA